ncbi:zinc finger protein 814-like isoform X2 [Ischnura elegans]|uniref:zinc finger protein 814-like isoform X2 n=1 Tax=Ischnura elegans TaxID=197161 RepID=UPI001ED8ABCB|nr:zinc finger protein 814-like isoform X2 [Ischnura elegans]
MALTESLQICRTCVLKSPRMLGIFGEGALGCSIADLINELLDLNVRQGDGLPDRICCNCLNELARFKKFKNISHEAKITLEYILKRENAVAVPQALQSIKDKKEDDSEDVPIVDLQDSSDDDSGAETVCAPSSPTYSVSSDDIASVCCFDDEDEDNDKDVEVISEPSTSVAAYSEAHSAPEEVTNNVTKGTVSAINEGSRNFSTLEASVGVSENDPSKEKTQGALDCSTSQMELGSPEENKRVFTSSRSGIGGSSFYEHLVNCEKETAPPICGICNENFPDSHSLHEHLVIHLNEKPEEDGLTNTSSASSTSSGFRLDGLDQIFMCGVCRKAFKRVFSLRTHMRDHKKKSPVVCGECKQCFKTLSKLCKHVVVSHHRGFLKCTNCSRRFLDAYSLRCHSNELCQGIRPFQCVICQTSFKTQNTLDVHMSECH